MSHFQAFFFLFFPFSLSEATQVTNRWQDTMTLNMYHLLGVALTCLACTYTYTYYNIPFQTFLSPYFMPRLRQKGRTWTYIIGLYFLSSKKKTFIHKKENIDEMKRAQRERDREEKLGNVSSSHHYYTENW